MSSAIIKTALVLSILFTAMAAGANAQRARVTIDFEFRIGERLYPAGRYNIEETNPSHPGVLRVAAERIGNSRIAVARRHERIEPTRPMLIFERFEGTYYLKELFLSHSSRGYAFETPKGRSDGKLAIAAADGKPQAKGN